MKKEKIKVTLGDIREAYYIMECPCDWKDFLESYLEDDEYEVILSDIVTIEGNMWFGEY